MEQDRYQKNPQLFISGMIFFVLSLSLLAFTAYLTPYLLLKWKYDVPEFILYFEQWFEYRQNMGERMASFVVFLILLGISLVATGLAYVLSNRLENQVHNVVTETDDESQPAAISEDTKETIGMMTKIIMIVAVVFIGLILVQWFIYIPPAGD